MQNVEPDSGIDFSKYFMPERLTPLYHTASYERLSSEQRRRYNQLHACYLNEQTIFFESAMARPILRSFVSQVPAGMAAELEIFMAEEAAHSAMFRSLNRRCWPLVYLDNDFYFIRLSPIVARALHLWVTNARRFPLFLWILLIQEERAMFCATEFLDAADKLEPNFVATQRRHLADEVGHVQWDERLLNDRWPRASHRWRRINAHLFGWLMREYFLTPKRSGMRVVKILVEEFPDLRPRWPELRAALLGLVNHSNFHQLAYSRAVTPKTFSRFDCWPEFHGMASVFPCYKTDCDTLDREASVTGNSAMR